MAVVRYLINCTFSYIEYTQPGSQGKAHAFRTTFKEVSFSSYIAPVVRYAALAYAGCRSLDRSTIVGERVRD
jgi:hypothetical protein